VASAASAALPLALQAGYTEAMGSPRPRNIITRVIRKGDRPPKEPDWRETTPEERIEAVWELTLQCLAWRQGAAGEPRLQRSVIRVQRKRR